VARAISPAEASVRQRFAAICLARLAGLSPAELSQELE
jgi:hypothetical protein